MACRGDCVDELLARLCRTPLASKIATLAAFRDAAVDMIAAGHPAGVIIRAAAARMLDELCAADLAWREALAGSALRFDRPD